MHSEDAASIVVTKARASASTLLIYPGLDHRAKVIAQMREIKPRYIYLSERMEKQMVNSGYLRCALALLSAYSITDRDEDE